MRTPERCIAGSRRAAMALALVGGAGQLSAQDSSQAGQAAAAPAVAALDSVAMPAVSDSFLVLVAPRDTGIIKQDVNAAVQRRATAENARMQSEGLRGGAQLRIEDMKRTISSINDRMSLAKKEKRDADVAKLAPQKVRAETEKALLERRASLREAEIDLQKKRAENADLERKMLELELQLALKRGMKPANNAGNLERRDYDQGTADLEQRYLETQRSYASSLGQVADGEKRFVERRLQLLQAQRKVATGGK